MDIVGIVFEKIRNKHWIVCLATKTGIYKICLSHRRFIVTIEQNRSLAKRWLAIVWLVVFQNCLGIYKVGICEVSQAGVEQETDIWTDETVIEAKNFHNMTKTDDKFFLWMAVKNFSESAFTANLWGIHCSFISLNAFYICETKFLCIFVQDCDKDCTRITDLVFAFTFAGANHFVTLQTTL